MRESSLYEHKHLHAYSGLCGCKLEVRIAPFLCISMEDCRNIYSLYSNAHVRVIRCHSLSQSTVANALDAKLTSAGRHTYILDGDNVRHGLNSGLGFSTKDRKENVRRVGEVARLMVDLGIIVLVPVIRQAVFGLNLGYPRSPSHVVPEKCGANVFTDRSHYSP